MVGRCRLTGMHEVGTHPGHHWPLLLGWQAVGTERHVDHAMR